LRWCRVRIETGALHSPSNLVAVDDVDFLLVRQPTDARANGISRSARKLHVSARQWCEIHNE
jgi:hypothetical protein